VRTKKPRSVIEAFKGGARDDVHGCANIAVSQDGVGD